MIQKNSILKPADNCGVLKSKVFHVYKGSKGKLAFCGNFLKTSAKEVKLENPIKKKTKLKAILVRTKFAIKKKDGSFNRLIAPIRHIYQIIAAQRELA